jgi:alanine dehydrogenase
MTLLLTRADVDRILSTHRAEAMDLLIKNVEDGYREIAAGSETEHPRVYLRSKNDPQRRPPGLFSMSALLGNAQRMGTRLLALGGAIYSDGDAILILFDQGSKRCLSIVWDQNLHYYRTGAPAAVAAKKMAKADAASAAVIGSGGIAEGTLSMICHVRPSIRTVRVFSPTKGHRERFAAQMSSLVGCDVIPVATAEDAVRDADVVITATDADRPLVPDELVKPGTFIAAMARNEVDPVTLRRGKIILSSVSAFAALDPPLRDPFPNEAVLGDLTDVLAGTVGSVFEPGDVRVFGGGAPLAMWDVAAASAMYDLARQIGIGNEISLYE